MLGVPVKNTPLDGDGIEIDKRIDRRRATEVGDAEKAINHQVPTLRPSQAFCRCDCTPIDE